MATPYLDLAGFVTQSVMPAEFIAELEAAQPGWILARLTNVSAWINARLRKRYPNTPFAAPYPEAVTGWLASIVTLQVAMRRGVDPNDLNFLDYKEAATTAKAEVLEAADSEAGKFDLPIAAGGDAQGSGIGLGTPLVYSEQSPYVWTDAQSTTGRFEDRGGGGTFGGG